MKLMVIDGNSVLNRAFYGVHLLTTKDGIYTNALLGFLNILLKLQKDLTPDAVAIAFDVSRHTFRHDLFEDYKATRKGMPEELRVQLPLIKEILTYMGYRLATAEGFEGDDILGTLANSCDESGDECVVCTGDRDCLQLASKNVTVCLIKTKENVLYNPSVFEEEYGFPPLNIVDLKALMGDSSDNIPGVKGIGEKTAMALISKNHSIDTIYADISAVEGTARVKKLLEDGKEQAYLSYKLATIAKDAPIEKTVSAYVKAECDSEKLADILKRLEMFSFFEKLNICLNPSSNSNTDSINDDKYAKMEKISAKAVDKSNISFDKGISLLKTENGGFLINSGNSVCKIEKCDTDEFLKSIFKQKVPIITFKAKPLYKLAKDWGYEDINITFDLELAAYLINPNSKTYDISTLIAIYLDDKIIECEDEFKEILSLQPLSNTLLKRLEQDGMLSLYSEIELPLCEVLADMEHEGFSVDKTALFSFGERIMADIEKVTEQIYKLAGEEFNINSTKELGNILFEKLSLPSGKKTKTGYSTNIDVLESLMDKHEIVPMVMEYRKLSKLHSTYVVGLLKEVAGDNRVHSTFNQTETRTGRISSAEPNVQNIPVRTKLGSEMRRFFVAREGYTLVDADYSQIELRILSHIANDKTMQQAFLDKADIHAITASQVFHHPLETLPSELRSRAKAINFGIVYGISAYSLSQDINVSVAEAKHYINEYLQTYNGVSSYMKEVVEQARKDGYVKTIYGRRRDLPDINATNKNVQAFAQRVALNMPIQGTAADIIKLAMIKVYKRLKKEELDARLILQVHDELIVEAPVFQAEQVKKILREEMENAATLAVPLTVDVNIGKNWYIAKG